MCQHVIDALLECHESKPYGKFIGACNDQKAALDACFRAEKEERRRKNFEKSMVAARRQAAQGS